MSVMKGPIVDIPAFVHASTEHITGEKPFPLAVMTNMWSTVLYREIPRA